MTPTTPPAKRIKARRADFYPDDWIAGTSRLSLEQRGAYIQVCAEIYSAGGPVPDIDAWMARQCGVSTRKWRTIKCALVDAGKIEIADGYIRQDRCERELERIRQRSIQQTENVNKRWGKTNLPQLGDGFSSVSDPIIDPENETKISRTSIEQNDKPLENNNSGDTNGYTKIIPARALPPSTNLEETNQQESAASGAGNVVDLNLSSEPVRGATDASVSDGCRVPLPEGCPTKDWVFQYARMLFGPKAGGGLAGRLLKKYDQDAVTVAAVLVRASNKDDPRRWIGGVLRSNFDKPPEPARDEFGCPVPEIDLELEQEIYRGAL